jgi:hypothetical protein
LLAKWSARHLREYRRVFKPAKTNEAGQLDSLPRRFAWAKRCVAAQEEREKVSEERRHGGWEEEWKGTWILIAEFIEVTR